jgi:hypothetical protein
MSSNKQETAVGFYLGNIFDIIGDGILDKLSIEQINKIHNLSKQAKEMEKERMIKLIQFIVSEQELVDYGSVSKETANYYLDKFNQGDKE